MAEQSELDGLRLRRLQSMLLLGEKQRLSMRLSLGLERMSSELRAASGHSVTLRLLAIRQRYRASIARLLVPKDTTIK